MSWDSLEGLSGISFEGESYRQETLERNGRSFDWHADIFTYRDFWEIEMIYIFNDPTDQLFNSITGAETYYSCEITDQNIYPTLDARGDETRIAAHIPIHMELDHEIAEFPEQYLEDLRKGFYSQIIRQGN